MVASDKTLEKHWIFCCCFITKVYYYCTAAITDTSELYYRLVIALRRSFWSNIHNQCPLKVQVTLEWSKTDADKMPRLSITDCVTQLSSLCVSKVLDDEWFCSIFRRMLNVKIKKTWLTKMRFLFLLLFTSVTLQWIPWRWIVAQHRYKESHYLILNCVRNLKWWGELFLSAAN